MLSDPLGLKTIGKIVDVAGTVVNLTDTVINITKELNEKPPVANDISDVNTQVIEKLLNTRGMTQYRGQHFTRATPKFKLKDGTTVKTYKNSARVDHVFLADSSGRMLFAGYVGWIHSENLEATIAEIKRAFV